MRESDTARRELECAPSMPSHCGMEVLRRLEQQHEIGAGHHLFDGHANHPILRTWSHTVDSVDESDLEPLEASNRRDLPWSQAEAMGTSLKLLKDAQGSGYEWQQAEWRRSLDNAISMDNEEFSFKVSRRVALDGNTVLTNIGSALIKRNLHALSASIFKAPRRISFSSKPNSREDELVRSSDEVSSRQDSENNDSSDIFSLKDALSSRKKSSLIESMDQLAPLWSMEVYRGTSRRGSTDPMRLPSTGPQISPFLLASAQRPVS